MPAPTDPIGTELIARAAKLTIGSLFRERVRIEPDSIALCDEQRSLTYGELGDTVARTAGLLAGLGIGHGDRVAVLAENRIEYLEVILACAGLGAIVACQNTRLAPPELEHCIRLVEPKLLLHSPRFGEMARQIDRGAARQRAFGAEFAERVAASAPAATDTRVDAEDPLLILYTSGTTGLPKGAVLSHRAEVARALLMGSEYDLSLRDTYAAWAPLYHMAAAEPCLGALTNGAKVIVVDGFQPARLCQIVETERLGWLVLMPGTLAPLIAELKRRRTRPRGIGQCGAMADLVPAHEIAEITRLLDAPYANTFASTETGLAPASRGLLAVGEVPERLAKRQTGYCEVRLVDADDREVPDGEPGEVLVRGPMLFSGYWRAAESNARDFRDGWFHMGDVMRRLPDRTLEFVDRVKYLIKSGGENIYPAEIERVLLRDERVADAVVVRRSDERWGEVPVAVVARRDDSLTVADLLERCGGALARFKMPKEIHFTDLDNLPRSTTGKIQRGEIEKLLEDGRL